ncbi:MAG: DUF3536 domain-containing protein [Terriglobales bacterium]
MDRYLCIHCHFYQPPRENPWLEAVEVQDSASPFHDWNERITAECYAPNSASRILSPEGRIVQIVNNYRKISFNFGSTLLSWMEDRAPEIYAKVLQADAESREFFGGHGSALAQAYNHMILPLANRRDKQTQVLWGIHDFRRRFGRDPEGMWLPETAVDVETLEVLAEQGIKFTVLAPHQARQARSMRRGVWRNVEGGKIDPTRAYACRLPSGRTISLFFYDGPISRAVAFEGLLSNGETFAARLLSGFNESRKWAQLMHIATDGETYGHHHRHGDMALAYALHHIESKKLAKITNYGEYLEKHPPGAEVEVLENTSWSCAHGIERWRSDCGCNSGGRAGWNQLWRDPLRGALDWLRDAVFARYEEAARPLLKDPLAARDDYIGVLLDRAPENAARFFEKHASHALRPEEEITALKLLEMQRHLMLMYTSCGWFFDELSDIETVQVIFYAGRAIQLSQELFQDGSEQGFLDRLEQAHANVPGHRNGAEIYHKWVKPAVISLLGVGAHYAISSVFNGHEQQDRIYCYNVDRQDYRFERTGRARLGIGKLRVHSVITHEQADISFAVFLLGDHNLTAGVGYFMGEQAYGEMVNDILATFGRADLPATLRAIDQRFPGSSFSLKSLFRDEQRRIVDQIMEGVLAEAEASYRGVYNAHGPLIRFLRELKMPLPNVLRLTAEFVLNGALRRAFAADEIEFDRIHAILDDAKRDGITLDAPGLSYVLQKRLERMVRDLVEDPHNLQRLREIETVTRLAKSLAFEVDLWKVQNLYWELLQKVYPQAKQSSSAADQAWALQFETLGATLGIRVDAPAPLPAVA